MSHCMWIYKCSCHRAFLVHVISCINYQYLTNFPALLVQCLYNHYAHICLKTFVHQAFKEVSPNALS